MVKSPVVLSTIFCKFMTTTVKEIILQCQTEFETFLYVAACSAFVNRLQTYEQHDMLPKRLHKVFI